MRSILQPIVDAAIESKVTPGMVVLLIEKGKRLGCEAFGNTASEKDGGVVVRENTIYDAASITKSAVTSTLLMHLVARDKLSLDSPVQAWLPELAGPGKDRITLKHLLGHASGLPAHRHFFESIWSGNLAGASTPRDALVVMAGAAPLEYETGSKTVYSDLGYILLGRLIERVFDSSLESIIDDQIRTPLGLNDFGFAEQIGAPLQRIAPSEHNQERGLLHGQVHDDNANASGGVCGHAGLFTTAHDLGKLAIALCESFQQDAFLPKAVVRRFWSTQAAAQTTWAMGWDTPSATPGVSHTGQFWPFNPIDTIPYDDYGSRGVGHLGFTGTAWWIAPKQQRIAVILSNRVYYSWEKAGIKQLRRQVMDALARQFTSLENYQ